ncbi:MAG: hypothetical protein LBB36_03485 [Fibromonadaceae bacterium]|jgi:hypothetical protein|nr:hypothetical protein [Fibromonadaceae bacterium]
MISELTKIRNAFLLLTVIFYADALAAQPHVIQCPATLCPDGGTICGRGVGKDEAEASRNANSDIAASINSSLEGNMDYTFISVEENGAINDGSTFNSREQTKFSLLNMQATQKLKVYNLGNGEIAAERYICCSDAAKPYLDSLAYLATVLKNASLLKINVESCKQAGETYRSIKKMENILIPLGQMGKAHALQKEYESVYAKHNKECSSAAKGVYVESNNASLFNKISSLIAGEGCVLSESVESSAITLRIKAQECDRKTDNIMGIAHCYYCVDINLQSNKTGKSLHKDYLSGIKGSYIGMDMERACKDAAEKSVPQAWEKLKGKINKGDCK